MRATIRQLLMGALAFPATLGVDGALASDEVQTRQLWDDAFRQKRAQPTKKPATLSAPSAAPVRPTDPETQSSAAQATAIADQLVGLTLWRLRPLRPEDEGSAAMVWATGDERLTAERIGTESSFAAGARVRLAIESGRTGFLYLIDRERYADGSLGEPFLIFPRQQIRGGDNRVRAGRVIEIPDLSDTPPYFTLKRSRPEHDAELLSVLVTDTPLREVSPGPEAVRLPRALVEQWEKRWSVAVHKLEAQATTPSLYTRAEREAAGTATRLLTYEEPLPQTLFHVPAPAGQPLLLRLDLVIHP